ncbi:MAG: flagellar basal body P-ring formation chaperone FlgA [Pseudomonadota bacterium]
MNALIALCLCASAPTHFTSSLVATEVIRAGEVISSQNTEPGEDGLSVEDQALLGKELKRTVYAGKQILAENTRAPRLIARNQLVTVKYQAGGLEITLTGRAMADAGAGDTIAVMNTSSRKLINGFVTSDGWVRAQ